MSAAPLVRPAAYAAGVLAGIKLVNYLRPVQVHYQGTVQTAEQAGQKFLAEVKRGEFQKAYDLVIKSIGTLQAQAGGIALDLDAQIKRNIILGALLGCAVVGALDWAVS